MDDEENLVCRTTPEDLMCSPSAPVTPPPTSAPAPAPRYGPTPNANGTHPSAAAPFLGQFSDDQVRRVGQEADACAAAGVPQSQLANCVYDNLHANERPPGFPESEFVRRRRDAAACAAAGVPPGEVANCARSMERSYDGPTMGGLTRDEYEAHARAAEAEARRPAEVREALDHLTHGGPFMIAAEVGMLARGTPFTTENVNRAGQATEPVDQALEASLGPEQQEEQEEIHRETHPRPYPVQAPAPRPRPPQPQRRGPAPRPPAR
jgi:hypothetical protein